MSVSSHRHNSHQRSNHSHSHHHQAHHHLSTDGSTQSKTLKRPFSVNNFEKKLAMFDDYLAEITYKNSEDSPDERRNKILGN